MLELTQGKLKEAAFFLDRLTRASGKIIGEEAEAFRYYLSAFLAAARSVTFVLQAEEKDKYDAWFLRWFEGQSEDMRELFNFMKGQRNQVLKEGKAEVTYSVQFVPIVKAPPDLRRQALAFHWFGPPGVPPPAIPRRTGHFTLDGTPAEVVETCRRYLESLQRLVADFSAAHPAEDGKSTDA